MVGCGTGYETSATLHSGRGDDTCTGSVQALLFSLTAGDVVAGSGVGVGVGVGVGFGGGVGFAAGVGVCLGEAGEGDEGEEGEGGWEPEATESVTIACARGSTARLWQK